MKASELRIGNLVYYAGIMCKVLGYHHDDYLHTNGVTAPVTSFQPIELTENWLLKMGFQKKLDSYYLNDLGLSWLTTEDNFQTEIKLAYSKWFLIDFKFVHQLQNFYFTIFGEELTIK